MMLVNSVLHKFHFRGSHLNPHTTSLQSLQLHSSLSLSILTAIFQVNLGYVSWCLLKQRMMEAVVTTGAINCAKLQSNHHQQNNTQFFTGRTPFLSPKFTALTEAKPSRPNHWNLRLSNYKSRWSLKYTTKSYLHEFIHNQNVATITRNKQTNNTQTNAMLMSAEFNHAARAKTNYNTSMASSSL